MPDTMRAEFEKWLEANPLRLTRKSNGDSQIRAAGMIGVSANTVIGWEAGSSIPTIENMERIYRYAGQDDIAEKWAKWINDRPND